MNQKNNLFLFSIDLEDVRMRIPSGEKYRERVPQMTEKYLQFLSTIKSKATFFIVGEVAEKYPSLIKMISDEGHEIACHSCKHITLDKQTKEEFKDDLQKNLDALYTAGAKEIIGYRAPTFSLTEKTKWAYEILSEMNFQYSSSVLPAKNPLYGWENFGNEIKKINNSVWEIPVSLSQSNFLKVPFGGGVYFRVLPYFWIKKQFKKYFSEGKPVLSYFHPYDIDSEQEHFMHPGINENKIFNFLMYYNRSSVFEKLEKLSSLNFTIVPYRNYLQQISTA